MNPVFVGYRCCGKTTLAMALAKELGMDWFDTDAGVENVLGTSIQEWVAAHGWDAFRRTESQVLAEALAMPGTVVATGGGIVMDGGNRNQILQNGIGIWLQADLATILSRLNPVEDARRPRLTREQSLEEETRQMLELRNPLYESVAKISLDTGGITVENAVEYIKGRLDHGRF